MCSPCVLMVMLTLYDSPNFTSMFRKYLEMARKCVFFCPLEGVPSLLTENTQPPRGA